MALLNQHGSGSMCREIEKYIDIKDKTERTLFRTEGRS
jgi:hypothetical protein